MTRSILDQGFVIFESATKSVLIKLDKIQFKAFRICSGSFETTHTPALLTEMGEMLLRVRKNEFGIQHWVWRCGTMAGIVSKCLLDGSWDLKKLRTLSTFLHYIKQLLGDFGLEGQKIVVFGCQSHLCFCLIQRFNCLSLKKGEIAFLKTWSHSWISSVGLWKPLRTLFMDASDLGLVAFSLKTVFKEGEQSDSVGRAVLRFLHSSRSYERIWGI